MVTKKLDLDRSPIQPLTICMIGAGGFLRSHLCEKLLKETSCKILAVDVYNDKIKHLLEPSSQLWTDRSEFPRINIKKDSCLEGLIKMADLTINLAAICTPADYNIQPLDAIYSNFIDVLPLIKFMWREMVACCCRCRNCGGGWFFCYYSAQYETRGLSQGFNSTLAI